MFNSVLTVCIGNICRSPMAEGLFKARIEIEGLSVRVESAGLGALVSRPADPISIDLMAARNIDISGHRARQLTPEILHGFDLVLVMETSHKDRIEHLAPLAKGRVFTLGHWLGFEIADPYRCEVAVFEEVLRLLDKGIESWMSYLPRPVDRSTNVDW